MPVPPLTDEQIAQALTGLPGWRVGGGELTVTYKVRRDRVPSLYTAVAAAEDRADHHARVTILFGTVGFALNTHDAGGAITRKDTAMAAEIAALAAGHEAVAADG